MADLGVTCERCGQHNPPPAKFCLECGKPLVAAGHQVREERKVVTVLFADLVGFTAQSEKLDPEEVRAILQPYHAGVRADLERFGGTVEKFIGDAVMALFGAPVAHEDDPERAVRAAMALRETLQTDGRLHVRVGITTGEALVALEARPESGEGMASGDVVNTAARLQSAAPVDGILVDEMTYRATRRSIEYRDHPPVTAKGKSEPLTVYEALSARARVGVDVRHSGLATLVGRQRELEILSGALERALGERQPQLVTVVGVPGIGKSRVVWELFQQVAATSRLVAWRQGRSLPYAESISFWALGEIVKAEAGILETDPPAAAGQKLSQAVAAVVERKEDAEWIERHLRPLIGLGSGTELRGDHRGEAFAAWRQYLEALADVRPLVLVFEDLHWADEGLLDFIDEVVDWATDVPLFLVGTGRPELLTRRPAWGGGKPNALTISLAPLSPAETSNLVASLVERAVMPVSMRESVLERAQGNPLYAEEFARLLAERGRMDELPESVHGIIAARLDVLSRQEKELLQDAAVMGKIFWSGAVASMRGLDRNSVEQALHGLERREFVRRDRRSSVAGETEYAFRHILVRDVAYGQIPRAERSQRHTAAAAWIESLARPADHAELLAQHYLAALEFARSAGRPIELYADRARHALSEAGERAMSLGAFGTAARYFEAALDLMASDDPARPVVLFGYGKALRVAEEGGADALAEAEAALRDAGNLELAAEAAVLQAELAWFAGDGQKTSQHLARASALVDGLAPSFSKAYVLSDLARYHMLRYEVDEAIARALQALEIADAMGLEEIKAHALTNLGTAREMAGDVAGRADLERAIEIANAINSPDVARAMNNLANLLDVAGEIGAARQLWRDALRRARELGNASVARFITVVVATIDYDDGDWDKSLVSLDAFVAEAEAAGGHSQLPLAYAIRGRMKLARGLVDQAIEDGEHGLAGGRRAHDKQSIAIALGWSVPLLVAIDCVADARPLADELLDVPEAGDQIGADLALALRAVGGSRLSRLAAATTPGPWREFYELVDAGSLVEAADLMENLLVLPGAALMRQEAARELIAARDFGAARSQLDLAASFWRSVGATRYLAEAEELYKALAAAPGEAALGSRQ